MKKLLISLGYLIAIQSCDVAIAQSWETVGGSGFQAGEYISLAIDGKGTPYVAYANDQNEHKVAVKKYNGAGGWGNVGSTGFSVNSAEWISLAIDRGITPYVAFLDWGNKKAVVKKYKSTGWVSVGGNSVSSGFAQFISLAIDGSGTLYMAYAESDDSNSNRATVKKFDGSSWVTVGGVPVSPGQCRYTSLAVDGNGTPYVAYLDEVSGYRATVMKYNGTNWESVGNTSFPADTPYIGNNQNFRSLALALDRGGTPYLAYTDRDNGGKATVVKYDGSSWVGVGSAAFSPGGAANISLAVDGNGTPYVAYSDGANDGKASVMKYNGIRWATVGDAGFSAELPWYACMALDNRGTPYVASYGWQWLRKINPVTVQKPGLGTLLSLYPNPVTTDNFTISAPEAGSLIVYNLEGEIIMTIALKLGTTAISLPSNTPNGIYFYRFTSSSGTTVTGKLSYQPNRYN